MDGLQLATKTEKPPGAAGSVPPPPIPSAESRPQDVTGQTQPGYSMPAPGGAPASAPPPPRTGRPVPPPAGHDGPSTSEGRKLGLTVGLLFLVCALGIGGWYLYQHPGLLKLPFGASAANVTASWPSIQLTGMAGAIGTDEAGSAILNGRLIAINQPIEGAILVEISNSGVVLEYKKERKLLRVGESTN